MLPGGAAPSLGGLSTAAAPAPQPGGAKAGVAWWIALLVALAAAAVLLLAGLVTFLVLRQQRKRRKAAQASQLDGAALVGCPGLAICMPVHCAANPGYATCILHSLLFTCCVPVIACYSGCQCSKRLNGRCCALRRAKQVGRVAPGGRCQTAWAGTAVRRAGRRG